MLVMFQYLPVELLQSIFSWLTLAQLASVATVCRDFFGAIDLNLMEVCASIECGLKPFLNLRVKLAVARGGDLTCYFSLPYLNALSSDACLAMLQGSIPKSLASLPILTDSIYRQAVDIGLECGIWKYPSLVDEYVKEIYISRQGMLDGKYHSTERELYPLYKGNFSPLPMVRRNLRRYTYNESSSGCRAIEKLCPLPLFRYNTFYVMSVWDMSIPRWNADVDSDTDDEEEHHLFGIVCRYATYNVKNICNGATVLYRGCHYEIHSPHSRRGDSDCAQELLEHCLVMLPSDRHLPLLQLGKRHKVAAMHDYLLRLYVILSLATMFRIIAAA